MQPRTPADEPRHAVAAPYVPFKTFLSAVESFESGLPNQVDRSVWPSHSGATQGQLLGAFRFLNLIDDRGCPGAGLRELVEGRENRKRTLRRVLEKSYPELTSLDLSKASPRQLDDTVRQYGLTGATHRKAVSFFLQAANWAELPLSVLLRKKTRETGPRRRKEPPAAPRAGTGTRPPPPGESKTIQLRSGGSLTLVTEFRFLELAREDREFVFGLLDQMAAYERSMGVVT
jgi:hypothetical protein